MTDAPQSESAESRQITDDMLVSELTVGEFKQLIGQLLANHAVAAISKDVLETPIEPQVKVQHKSLDDFMNGLTDNN